MCTPDTISFHSVSTHRQPFQRDEPFRYLMCSIIAHHGFTLSRKRNEECYIFKQKVMILTGLNECFIFSFFISLSVQQFRPFPSVSLSSLFCFYVLLTDFSYRFLLIFPDPLIKYFILLFTLSMNALSCCFVFPISGRQPLDIRCVTLLIRKLSVSLSSPYCFYINLTGFSSRFPINFPIPRITNIITLFTLSIHALSCYFAFPISCSQPLDIRDEKLCSVLFFFLLLS